MRECDIYPFESKATELLKSASVCISEFCIKNSFQNTFPDWWSLCYWPVNNALQVIAQPQSPMDYEFKHHLNLLEVKIPLVSFSSHWEYQVLTRVSAQWSKHEQFDLKHMKISKKSLHRKMGTVRKSGVGISWGGGPPSLSTGTGEFAVTRVDTVVIAQRR